MLGGNINPEKVVANPEVELKSLLELTTGRTDIRIERVRLVSIWRYITSSPILSLDH